MIATWSRQFADSEPNADGALMTLIAAMARGVGRDRYLDRQRALLDRIDSRPYLAAIECPTMLLCGRGNALVPFAVQEASAAMRARA